MAPTFRSAGRKPGAAAGRPRLIAAIDGNHNGNAALAARLVTLAAEAGADGVKFAIRRDDRAGAALAAARRAARRRVEFVAAPYDLDSLAVARRLRPDAFQIDPPVVGDRALVRAVAKAGRPVMLVAGMCTARDIRAALRELARLPVLVLHTVASVPLPRDRARLGYIEWLRRRFRKPVGYLGWESGVEWALVAAALGAGVIEKPFTLDRSLEGPLHAWSLNPAEFGQLADRLEELAAALAPVGPRRVLAEELDVLESSAPCLVARRAFARGRRLRASDLTAEPPMRGLSARLAPWLVGKRLLYDVDAGEPITFGMVE